MRFAISAVAAASGLFLLGLAFYGQPAVYLRQAREQWDALMDVPAIPPPEADRVAAAEAMPPPQHQMVQPEDQRAAQPLPPPQPAVPAAVASLPAALPRGVDQPEQPAPRAAAPGLVETAPPAVAVPERREATAESPLPQFESPKPEPTGPVPQRLVSSKPAFAPPAPTLPEQHEASAEPVPSAPDSTKPEPTNPGSRKHDAAKPAPQRLAMVKPAPAPPPLPQPSPPPQAADDTQSVLARLRQLAPAPRPVQQSDLPSVPEPRPWPAVPSPSLPRLTAARGALANGRIDDARRLLQEAQLQLVFRPIDAAGDDPPAAGKGAADVAHALEALGANDVPLSRRYVDAAMNDLSGNGTVVPVQQSDLRASGYAPAYPPR